MVREFVAERNGEGARVAIAVSRFNEELTQKLLEGALAACREFSVRDERITVAWAPGAFELPLLASELARHAYDVVVCLGVVLKGETAHFEHVSAQAARGIADVARRYRKPVMFGVLTTYTRQQAIDRCGGVLGNRGYDVAVAGLEAADVLYKVSHR